MKTLRLYGALARLVGRRSFTINVASAAEAICFLVSNFPFLESHMATRYYQVRVNSYTLDPEKELQYPVGDADTIAIVPVITGAGGSAAGRIAVGLGLIATSFLIGPGAALFGVAVKPLVFGIGASLVLGGVSQLLTPTPKLNTGLDSSPAAGDAYAFNQIVNVTRQGVPVPLIYGEPICGSVVISAGLSVDQINEIWRLY